MTLHLSARAPILHPLEEVDISKFRHLIHIAFGFDHFLIVEQDPSFFASFRGSRFADERDVVPAKQF